MITLRSHSVNVNERRCVSCDDIAHRPKWALSIQNEGFGLHLGRADRVTEGRWGGKILDVLLTPSEDPSEGDGHLLNGMSHARLIYVPRPCHTIPHQVSRVGETGHRTPSL